MSKNLKGGGEYIKLKLLKQVANDIIKKNDIDNKGDFYTVYVEGKINIAKTIVNSIVQNPHLTYKQLINKNTVEINGKFGKKKVWENTDKKADKIINATNFTTIKKYIEDKINEANQNNKNNNEPTTSNNTISSEEINININENKIDINIDGLIKEIETFDKQTLTGYIKKSNDVLASIRENIKKILESNLTNSEVTEQLQDQIKNITLENDRLKEEKIELEEEKKEKDATIVKLTNQINENNRLFAQTKEKSVSTKKQLDNLKKQQDNNKNTETDLRNQINNLNEKLKEINDTREKLVGELDNEKKKVEEMTREINKINMIRTHFNSIVKKTEELSANNTTIKDAVEKQVNSINNKQSSSGGYQYKSKNKTRSKRMLKLNRFGLLKSKSKTRKSKKKLKVKKNKKSVKGGMKTRSKPKRKSKKSKKTRKGKKKNNKRK